MRLPEVPRTRAEEDNKPTKLCIHLQNGVRFIDPADIHYCMAQSNYAEIILRNGERIIISKPLKWLESRLRVNEFIRPHASYIVNVRAVRQVQRNRIELDNASFIPVSRRRYKSIINALKSRYA